MVMVNGLKMLSMLDLQKSMELEMILNDGVKIYNQDTGSAYQYMLRQGIVMLHYNLPNKSSACAVRAVSRDGIEFAEKVMEAHIAKGMIAVEW